MQPIYFPRHQSRFLRMGDVGSHPQFRHLNFPPDGYEFDSRKMGSGEWLRSLPRAIGAAMRSWRELIRFGREERVPFWSILRFLWSRGFSFVPAPAGSAATFLPTYPFTHQNEKWFLEIEDVTTLFRPFILNGRTASVNVRDLPGYPLVKRILASKNCLGILTHVRSTQESITKIFGDSEIDAKTKYLPAPYIPSARVTEGELNKLRGNRCIQFFFNNSWHQDAVNFYLRGGISILEAFDRALHAGLPVKLVLRSKIPKELQAQFAELLKHPQVEFLDGFMDQDKYLNTLRASHYFLLPSARLHVVSLLESMYYGAVPIVSDGWGISDYVDAGETAHVLKGVYGKVSWADEISGELRENYSPMYRQPGILTEELCRKIRKVVSTCDHGRMSLNGHRFVRDKMSVQEFNPQFSAFLKRGLPADYNFLESQ